MNIVQLHNRVEEWLDTVNSPRFDTIDISGAIDTATKSDIKDRYGNDKMKKPYWFQSSQRVRDELADVVSINNIIYPKSNNNDIIEKSQVPSNYYYLLSMKAKFVVLGSQILNGNATLMTKTTITDTTKDFISEGVSVGDIVYTSNSIYEYREILTVSTNSITYAELNGTPNSFPYANYEIYNAGRKGYSYPKPVTYQELIDVKRNPRKSPNVLAMPSRSYFNESEEGYEIQIGNDAVLLNVDIVYLKEPVEVFYGYERNSSYTFSTNTAVIVNSETCVYNGVTYSFGAEFTVDTALTNKITSGTVVDSFVNTEMPLNMHEDIALSAAKILDERISEKGKEQMLSIREKTE